MVTHSNIVCDQAVEKNIARESGLRDEDCTTSPRECLLTVLVDTAVRS